MNDILGWMSRNLKIIDMGGNLIPLNVNIAQMMVHKTLLLQEEADLPVRAIILKARREGVSTYVQARFFEHVNTHENKVACVASADIDATQKVFNMTKLFQGHIPNPRKTAFSRRSEIVYAEPHRSSFLCQTAGKQVLGRGGAVNKFHATEFAFWADAKNQFGGAAQEIPDRAGTDIIIESTANGVGDAFYDMFWQARDDWVKTKDPRNYLPIFLPWFIFPDYALPAPDYFELDDEEKDIKRRHDLNLNQMYWRRWAIKNKCQGDPDLFMQEYPATSLEAFRSSGTPIFSKKIIENQKKTVADIKYGVFIPGDKVTFEVVDRKINCWAMADPVIGECQYTLGIDTIEGKASDVADAKSKIDFHGCAVFNRTRLSYDCVFKGRIEQWELAEQCILAARYYNEAYVAPEMPIGMIVLQKFKDVGYPNIYNRTIHEDRISEDISEEYGWRTTTVTRKWLVDGFIAALRDGQVRVRIPWIIEEMEVFIRDKSGKPVHMPGKYDDCLFGAMIAMEMHKRVPYESGMYPDESTGGSDEVEPALVLAKAGAIDPGVEEDYDEYL